MTLQEKIEALPAEGRLTCVDYLTSEEHIILTDDLKALSAALDEARSCIEASGIECAFKDISTCIAEADVSGLVENKFCGGCMRRLALARIDALTTGGKG